jgi:hypothetical protein
MGWEIDKKTGKLVNVKDNSGTVDLAAIDKIAGTGVKVAEQSAGMENFDSGLVKNNVSPISTGLTPTNSYFGTLNGKGQFFTQDTLQNADPGSISSANVGGNQYNGSMGGDMTFKDKLGVAGLAVGTIGTFAKNAGGGADAGYGS